MSWQVLGKCELPFLLLLPFPELLLHETPNALCVVPSQKETCQRLGNNTVVKCTIWTSRLLHGKDPSEKYSRVSFLLIVVVITF